MKSIIVTVIALMFSIMLSAQINAERMLLIGRNALYYDDYALSIQYFNHAINAKPHLYEPYFYRALAKFYLEDYNGAEADCTRSLELNPYYINSYEVRGLSRINSNNYSGAAADYAAALDLEPDHRSMWHNLVLCYMQLDSLTLADSTLTHFISHFPRYADAYLLRAEVSLKQGDTLRAEQVAEQALQAEPYNADAQSLRGLLYMHRDSFVMAEEHFTEALRLQPRNASTFINRALCRYQQDNLRGAMSDYDLALDIDPNNFAGHYNRGLLRATVGEDNLAIEDFDFILGIDPDDIMTLFNRARLYHQTGDYQRAIRDYTRVIEEFPKFLYGYELRADAYRKIGDTQHAIRDEEHILRETVAHRYGYSTPTSRQANRTRKQSQVDPNNYQQLVYDESEEPTRQYSDPLRGKIQNRTTEATLLPLMVLDGGVGIPAQRVVSQHAIDVANLSKDAIGRFQSGIDHALQTDELPMAEAAFTVVINASPDFAEAYYNRAYVRAMQGNYSDAIADLDTALRLQPTFAIAYYNRAITTIMQAAPDANPLDDLSRAGELGIYQAYSIIKQQNKKQ